MGQKKETKAFSESCKVFGKIGGRGPLFLGNLTKIREHEQESPSNTHQNL